MKKPNNKPIYINNDSNHSPSVLKLLPKSICKRLFEISSFEEIFHKLLPKLGVELPSAHYASGVRNFM